jgi:hypothetical protein
MAYTPNNTAVFIAAYAGACAGMGVSGRNPTSSSATEYAGLTLIAGAYAQEFDTLWGLTASNTLVLSLIQTLSECIWLGRSPPQTSPFQVAAKYATEVNALVAITVQSETYFTAQGITPDVPVTVPNGTKSIIWRPGVATASPFISTWAEVQAIIDAAGGDVIVYIDTSSGTATITGSTDCKKRTIFRVAEFYPVLTAIVVTIANGAQLTNPAAFEGNMRVDSAATVVAPLVLTGSLRLNGAVLNLTAGAARAFVDITTRVALDCSGEGDFRKAGSVVFAAIAAAQELVVIYTNHYNSDPGNDRVSGAVGTTLRYIFDGSCRLPTNAAFLGTTTRVPLERETLTTKRNGVLGPTPEIEFSSDAVTVRTTGNYDVSIMCTLSSQNPSENVSFFMIVDGAVVVTAPQAFVTTDPVDSLAFVALTWSFTNNFALGTTHTFGIRAVNATGNDLTASLDQIFIVVRERNTRP